MVAVPTPSVVSSIAVAADLAGPPSEASTAVTGASPAPAASTTTCRRAGFATHAGLGAAAVDRYLWQPFQRGAFASGAQGRSAAVVTAALAGSVALREYTLALADLQGCPGTEALAAALAVALARGAVLTGGLRSGSVDAAALAGVNDQLAAIRAQARTLGITIPEPAPTADLLGSGSPAQRTRTLPEAAAVVSRLAGTTTR